MVIIAINSVGSEIHVMRVIRTPWTLCSTIYVLGSVWASAPSSLFSFFFFLFFTHIYFPAPEQAVVTGVVPSSPRFLPSILIAHRVQQSHCSSIFHWALLTHALALSASQFVHKKKSPRIYTSMHSGGFELTKLTYTRLEDIIWYATGRPAKQVWGLCRRSV